MKVKYSEMRCPNCGSKKIYLLEGEVFVCEYCKGKINFNIDEIDFSNESKILVSELKEKYTEKLKNLYEEKQNYRNELVRYKKLASPIKLFTIAIISLLFFSALLLSGTQFILSVVGILISTGVLIFSINCNKKKEEKYKPFIILYASKIVECEEQISYYTKFLSKLG